MLNSVMKDVVHKEVTKWLDVDIVHKILYCKWISPVHCMPKKGGTTVIANEKNELIQTTTMTGSLPCPFY